MNKAILRNQIMANTPVRQRGVLTTFTGVMILVLLTLMMFFAIRVGVFEQRVSANDSRQKLAFHTAESGINHAKEFFLANSVLIASDEEDFLANGSDGWLADTAEKRWLKCRIRWLAGGYCGEALVEMQRCGPHSRAWQSPMLR